MTLVAKEPDWWLQAPPGSLARRRRGPLPRAFHREDGHDGFCVSAARHPPMPSRANQRMYAPPLTSSVAQVT
jgi:hypothetical protein